MKKTILILAIVVSLITMSFTTKEKKSDYVELSSKSKVIKLMKGFTKYQQDHYTADKGEWNYRLETWTLTDNTGSTNELQNTLSNY